MFGLGTLINSAAIVVGGVAGHFFGRFLSESCRETLSKSCGISCFIIGIAGALQEMFTIGENGTLSSGGSMLLVLSMALGALIGEIINIEGLFERFGEWLKVKTGNAKDKQFVNGFVTASLTVCVGAMAIVGAIKDGLVGDSSILITKSILDLVIIIVMTCSMGMGCAFSALPVFVLEGGVTLLAKLISPIMTDAALSNISLVGSAMICCVGINIVWGKTIRVANLLPSLVLAVGAAFLPFSF